jgi:hypothetical protein
MLSCANVWFSVYIITEIILKISNLDLAQAPRLCLHDTTLEVATVVQADA